MASTALDREAIDEAVARGSDLLKQGKLEDALKAFRSALLIDDKNARVLALLGLTYFKAGQFTQAQPIYEELVERAPTDASHRLNLGLVYLKLGESDRAIGSLESSRALDPSQGRAVSYLGLAYARAGRYAEAYRSFILAGQNDLASEIEVNLTAAERESIDAQLRADLEPRTAPPRPPPPKSSAEIPLMSMPAIVIDRPPQPDHGGPIMPGSVPIPANDNPPSSVEIQIETETDTETEQQDAATDKAFSDLEAQGNAPAPPPAPFSEIRAPEMSDSQQFVLPQRSAVPEPAEGQSMISRAVEIAVPTSAIASSTKVHGSTLPIPLSQLATEALVRPEDGAELFEVTSAGALVIRVTERMVTRLDGVHVTGGDLEYEPATRRSRGSQTDEKFDYGGTRLHVVTGKGYLIAAPSESSTFTAVTLDDDIFYLREDLIFAFEASLRWENGNVPGLRGRLPVVQFRGDGAVALRTVKPLIRVKLPAQGVLYVDASRLAGWIGRVIPRAVVPPKNGPMGEICVECTGEGVVLIDPSGTMPPVVDRARTPSKPEPVKATPPPPPPPTAEAGTGDASGPIDLDVVKNANWLTDGEEGDEAADDSSRDEI